MTGLVQQHVDQWVNKYPILADFFNEGKFVRPLLEVCRVVTKGQTQEDKLIRDFIDGLVLLHASFSCEGEDQKILETESDLLTLPVFNLVTKIVRSNLYQQAVLDSANLGDTVKRKGLEIPVTKKRIKKFLIEQNTVVFSKSDVRSIIQDFIVDRVEFHQAKPSLKKNDVVNKSAVLDDFCHNGAKDKILAVLQGFGVIDPLSSAWVFKDKSYKSVAATLMKVFNTRGYFIKEPTTQEYKAILNHEFRLDISERTIDGSKANEAFLEKRMRGIPLFKP